MKKNKSEVVPRPKDLELSLFTLWSLFILIDQHYQAIFKYRSVLNKDYKLENEDEVCLDTIYEALVYQIFLKGCSFLDEWDKIFGIKTEIEYKKVVQNVKTIAKPARKFVNSWKGLREFRNQAIAHNHRDEQGNNIYYIKKSYHTPNGLGELALFIYCIEKMSKIAAAMLMEEWQKIISKGFQTGFDYKYSKYEYSNRDKIIDTIDLIDKAVEKGFKEKFPSVINTTSNYGDFLRAAI